MNLTRRIPELLLITLIAVLIWLFAEARNVQTFTPAAPVPLKVVATGKDMIVTSQSPLQAAMRFKGATAELDKLRRQLSDGLTIPLAAAEPGTRTVNLLSHLSEVNPLSTLSVNVMDLEPSQVEVTIDKLVKVPGALNFRPAEVQLVGGAAQIIPAKVTLTAPQALLGPGVDAMTLEVDPEVDIKSLPPGVEQSIQAEVKLPIFLRGQPNVTVDPASVQVVFTIDKKEDAFKVPSVPVFIATPPGEQDRYRIVLGEESKVLKDVKISGPSELIQKIRAGEMPVIATLRLSGDELVKSVDKEMTGTVRFELPAQLTVESSLATVRYTVTKRQ